MAVDKKAVLLYCGTRAATSVVLRSIKSSTSLLALISVLCGCVGTTKIKQVSVSKPVEVAQNERKKPIQFKRIVVKVKRGEEIGTIHAGLLNIPQRKLYWRRGGYLTITDDDFTERFREELSSANYEVVGNPDALFEDSSAWKAELLVAGLVKELKLNTYFPMGGFGNFRSGRGEAYIKVDWQIFSRLDRQVVLELTTEGSVAQRKLQPNGPDEALADAFSVAVRNLLGERRFHDLVVSSEQESKMEGRSAELRLKEPESSGSIVDKMPDIQTSVVTLFAIGMGSGFVISDDGYILSNQHVVGEARYVRIKFSTGREVNGEVVSKHRGRDVALIKCGEQGLKALPIRKQLPSQGDDVYAIGTPLRENLSQTVTKGIVSGFRSFDGVNYIQSDVAVNPGNSGGPLLDKSGNVVGITVMKRTDAESLAFFIPIADAIRFLEIK